MNIITKNIYNSTLFKMIKRDINNDCTFKKFYYFSDNDLLDIIMEANIEKNMIDFNNPDKTIYYNGVVRNHLTKHAINYLNNKCMPDIDDFIKFLLNLKLVQWFDFINFLYNDMTVETFEISRELEDLLYGSQYMRDIVDNNRLNEIFKDPNKYYLNKDGLYTKLKECDFLYIYIFSYKKFIENRK